MNSAVIELAGHAIATDAVAAVGPVRPCFKVGKANHATFVVCLRGGQSLPMEYDDEAIARRDRERLVAQVWPPAPTTREIARKPGASVAARTGRASAASSGRR